ncbi:hypothetical protein [Actinomadura sp. BRA 177]|uniref:hypothetical protein n=1 Tax=Actinomadura sp. BRA 177 TaxID=2745202 RepID=UPI00159632D8|nr:hypothetical protein [Actinomadura sp. BRA 177]
MNDLPDGPVLPAAETEVVLRPPRTLKYLACVQATAGALLVLAAGYAFWIQAFMPALCLAFMGLAAVGATLNFLMGKVKFGPDGLHNHEDSVSQVYMAWEGITALERRRRLWTERIVAVSPATSVTLGAPARLRFRRDPRFEAAVADLSRRAGREVTRGRPLLTWRYAVTHVAILATWTFLFVTFDPIWHHQAWPGRSEARALPDPCRVLAPAAKQLAPEQKPLFYDFTDNPICQFDAISLRLAYQLHKYQLGQDGGIEQAEKEFREGPGGPTPDDKGARPLPGVGDEATIVTSTYKDPSRVTQIQISVRRANVTVWLSYTPRLKGRDSTSEAVALAEHLARTATDRIKLD